jgi:hypothetical protein
MFFTLPKLSISLFFIDPKTIGEKTHVQKNNFSAKYRLSVDERKNFITCARAHHKA